MHSKLHFLINKYLLVYFPFIYIFLCPHPAMPGDIPGAALRNLSQQCALGTIDLLRIELQQMTARQSPLYSLLWLKPQFFSLFSFFFNFFVMRQNNFKRQEPLTTKEYPGIQCYFCLVLLLFSFKAPASCTQGSHLTLHSGTTTCSLDLFFKNKFCIYCIYFLKVEK